MSDNTSDLVLLIHGTGAGEPSDTGDRWWQLGSAFGEALKAHLCGRIRFPAEGQVFHWSGRNSERDRRNAGLTLLGRLYGLEDDPSVSGYHLIGHSHGGSALWHTLRTSVGRRRPLKKLRSWATVGTPFLHFGVRRARLWSVIPLIAWGVAAAFIGRLLYQVGESLWFGGWSMVEEIQAEVEPWRFWSYVALLALLLLGGLVLLIILASRVAVTAWALGRAARDERHGRRALRWYGKTYLGLWCRSDEAINGLRHSVGVRLPIIPRIPARPNPTPRRFRTIALAPFRWVYHRLVGPVYNIAFGEPADAFISEPVNHSSHVH